MCASVQACRSIRSVSRPGVATTTSARRTWSDLPADRHAAVDRRDAHADGLAQWRQYVGDLLGEFAGGHQDEGAERLLLPWLSAGCQPGQQREAEGQGLAGSGLGPAEDVTASQGVGHGPGLDGERRQDATGGHRGDQAGVHAELSEAGCGRCGGSGGRGKGRLERRARFAPRFLATPLWWRWASVGRGPYGMRELH